MPTLPTWYPLETNHDNDPMRTLIAAAANLRAAESACVQVLACPAATGQIRKLRRGVQVLRTGNPRAVLDPAPWLGLRLELFGPTRRRTHDRPHYHQVPLAYLDPQRERDARAGIDKLTSRQWEVAIRLGHSCRKKPLPLT